MERDVVIGIVIGVVFVLWTLVELWWHWFRPYSAGEALKDELQRQYGSGRTLRYLFMITLALLIVWVVATSGWSPG